VDHGLQSASLAVMGGRQFRCAGQGQKKEPPAGMGGSGRSNGFVPLYQEPTAWRRMFVPAALPGRCSAVAEPLAALRLWLMPGAAVDSRFSGSRRGLQHEGNSRKKSGMIAGCPTKRARRLCRLRKLGPASTQAMAVNTAFWWLRTRSIGRYHVVGAAEARLPGSEILCKTINASAWRGHRRGEADQVGEVVQASAGCVQHFIGLRIRWLR